MRTNKARFVSVLLKDLAATRVHFDWLDIAADWIDGGDVRNSERMTSDEKKALRLALGAWIRSGYFVNDHVVIRRGDPKWIGWKYRTSEKVARVLCEANLTLQLTR